MLLCRTCYLQYSAKSQVQRSLWNHWYICFGTLQGSKFKVFWGNKNSIFFVCTIFILINRYFFKRISFEDDESKEDQVDEAHVLATPDVLNVR